MFEKSITYWLVLYFTIFVFSGANVRCARFMLIKFSFLDDITCRCCFHHDETDTIESLPSSSNTTTLSKVHLSPLGRITVDVCVCITVCSCYGNSVSPAEQKKRPYFFFCQTLSCSGEWLSGGCCDPSREKEKRGYTENCWMRASATVCVCKIQSNLLVCRAR